MEARNRVADVRLQRGGQAVLRAIPTPILLLFACDLLVAVMHLVGPDLPNSVTQGGDPDGLWDMAREGNVSTWYASIQLGLLGGLMVGAVSAWEHRRESVLLAAPGLFFLFLSLDELAGLHEKLGRYLNTVSGHRSETALGQTGPWMVVAAPVFLAMMALAGYAGRDLLRGRPRVQLLYVSGLVLYVASFAGLEIVQNFVADTAGWEAVTFLEETGEMTGVTLLLWATYDLVRSHGVRLFAPVHRPP